MRLSRVLAPVAVTVVVGLVVAVAGVVSRVVGVHAVAAADHAYRAGDCTAAAAAQYRSAAKRVDWVGPGLADAARTRATECDVYAGAEQAEQADSLLSAEEEYARYQESYPKGFLAEQAAQRHAAVRERRGAEALATADAAGSTAAAGALDSYGEAVTDYVTVLDSFSDTAAVDGVAQGTSGLADAAIALATTGRHCDAVTVLDVIAGQGAPAFADAVAKAKGQLPGSLYECGVAHYSAAENAAAVETLQRLSAEYPDSPLVAQARPTLIAAEVADGQAAAGELPQPLQVGGSGSGNALVTIANGSSRDLEILYTGPTADEVAVPSCASCLDLSFDIGSACTAGDEPSVTVELPPGTYQFLVRSGSGSDVTPYSGSWDLQAGAAYDNCFYIVTGF